MWTLVICFGISILGCSQSDKYPGFNDLKTCQDQAMSADHNGTNKRISAFCVLDKK
jgi:hypothetical protein